MVDPEGFQVNATFEPYVMLSSFVRLFGDTLWFAPSQPYHMGEHEIHVILTDTHGKIGEEKFILKVEAPP